MKLTVIVTHVAKVRENTNAQELHRFEIETKQRELTCNFEAKDGKMYRIDNPSEYVEYPLEFRRNKTTITIQCKNPLLGTKKIHATVKTKGGSNAYYFILLENVSTAINNLKNYTQHYVTSHIFSIQKEQSIGLFTDHFDPGHIEYNNVLLFTISLS
ncbi:MAG: hypothetical protein WC254_03770 [Candidatus Woesearchaeota archaeon]|jgi:hypothetical protein